MTGIKSPSTKNGGRAEQSKTPAINTKQWGRISNCYPSVLTGLETLPLDKQGKGRTIVGANANARDETESLRKQKSFPESFLTDQVQRPPRKQSQLEHILKTLIGRRKKMSAGGGRKAGASAGQAREEELRDDNKG